MTEVGPSLSKDTREKNDKKNTEYKLHLQNHMKIYRIREN